MSDMCTFRLTIHGGDKARLSELSAFLTTAIETAPEEDYADFYLSVCKLWPDMNKEHNHTRLEVHAWDDGDVLEVKSSEKGGYEVICFGSSPDCPPLDVLARLSKQFPDLDLELGGTTEHELFEKWKAKAGELLPIRIGMEWVRYGIEAVFVRDGQDLDTPEFETNANYERHQEVPEISPKEIVERCGCAYDFFRPERECPGVANGTLLARAEEFLKTLRESGR